MKHGESRVEIKVVGLNQLKLLSFIKRNGIELFDINSEDRKKALYTTFKAKNGKFKIRDTIRFDSLLSDNNNKILLNKKHRLDPKIQIALEKAQKVKDENEFEDTLKIKLNRKFKLKKIE